MAQLRQVTHASAGPIPTYVTLDWREFVHHVLELTVKAYQEMLQDGIAKKEWEENVFSIRLGYDYIRTIAFDLDLPIRVTVRPKIHTPNMVAGTQATIEAKEIDMVMYDMWERDYHTKHFVWEAKRVGDRHLIKKYSKLSSEYVNEAIYRFVRKDYADGLSEAGILAYVLAGNPMDIVSDINRTMGVVRKNPPLPASCHIRSATSIAGFHDVFVSDHYRIDNTSIKLHHLFLTFSF